MDGYNADRPPMTDQRGAQSEPTADAGRNDRGTIRDAGTGSTDRSTRPTPNPLPVGLYPLDQHGGTTPTLADRAQASGPVDRLLARQGTLPTQFGAPVRDGKEPSLQTDKPPIKPDAKQPAALPGRQDRADHSKNIRLGDLKSPQPLAASIGKVNVPQNVIRSIMRSEGPGGTQDGKPELYGFRQHLHNGYDQILAARERYGQGSPQEVRVVARLLEQRAQRAGAQNFTDPGVQAAIMSAAHMRGVEGAQAILNYMVTGHLQKAAHLTPETIATIQHMAPESFQMTFRLAREHYDRHIYGNTTTRQDHRTWWQRFGGGLINRYDRERQEFLNLSGDKLHIRDYGRPQPLLRDGERDIQWTAHPPLS